MKVMIVVTHLLGAGHLSRALALGRAVAAAGAEAVVVSGGRRPAHLDAAGVVFEQLPPVRSDGADFSSLLNETGAPVEPEYLAARRRMLLEAFSRHAPSVLVTELFPFGRRVLAAEFDALLATARACAPRPAILCSVRDILAPPSKPKRAAECEARLAGSYDAVLAHADPAFVALEASWPVTPAIRSMLRYTGFVAPPASAETVETTEGGGEIIVAAGGGGQVGDALFEAAIGASGLVRDRPWRMLVSGVAGRLEAMAALGADAPIRVEAARPDYRSVLRRAALSVSQCGYNTALDVLGARVPAVFCPFEEGAETEQLRRACALAESGPYEILRARQLSAETLAESCRRALARTAPPPEIRSDGAEESARMILEYGAAR